MSFWDWLRQRLWGTPPERDVSRLSGQGDSPRERVDTSGGPLKPEHRRKALRDRRLFPKARAPLGKRPKVMEWGEAQRLFSDTMRTRNRQIRDLLCDEEQLRRLGLPLWRNEVELALALEVRPRQLMSYAFHTYEEAHPHYVAFSRLKRDGSPRVILAPKRRLKALQRKLCALLVERLPVSEQAHGFRKGRSIVSGARLHVGKRVVVSFDVENFFPRCTWYRVRGLLLAYGYSYPVATVLALLTSECERQPVDWDGHLMQVPIGPRYCVQGAPTSPGLANALALKLDRRLQGLARKLGMHFTRYADDLTFSGDDPARVGVLLRAVAAIADEEGFSLKRSKTRVMRSGRRQTVTGLVVNRELTLPREQRRRLRAELHRSQEANRVLLGRLAFLWMIHPAQASQLWPTAWPSPLKRRCAE